ncbi:S-methyl-5-thioribose-1-phosphate isomerase [Bacteroidota bacterium]
MLVGKKHYRTIWVDEDNPEIICIIDQRHLPHHFVIEKINTTKKMAVAIKDMHLRGAGLIGAAAGYGMYLATLELRSNQLEDQHLLKIADLLKATRPTAVNLAWAVDRQLDSLKNISDINEKVRIALEMANTITDEDAAMSRKIGEHGVKIIEEISRTKNGDTVNILTHCNAGWLAFVDHGTATSPVYAAFEKGIKVHVWVDETRPRNQGASLTAWELGEQGIPHTVIADNTGGHLMQHGLVDMAIVGTDRTTRAGDVANKIGTYLKALAAHDNKVPFYVALPSSTIDWEIKDGVKEIPIEERDGYEVKYIQGLHEGSLKEVLLTPDSSPAMNYGFDVTPARLITGLITERGICKATESGILSLFPERQ